LNPVMTAVPVVGGLQSRKLQPDTLRQVGRWSLSPAPSYDVRHLFREHEEHRAIEGDDVSPAFTLSFPSHLEHLVRLGICAPQRGVRVRIKLQEIEWSNHAQCLYETHYADRGALDGDFGNSKVTPDL
jgi:hypothetical protein